MPGELLLDTGALVTLLDRSQPRHRSFVRFFETWENPVVNTEAVLTEATHLLGRVIDGSRTCLQFFLSGGRRTDSIYSFKPASSLGTFGKVF
jgi:predicted nucleic acid-binding protein